jgi:hypothetical protein
MAEPNQDARARAARERCELAVVRSDGALALDACRMMAELFDAGFRLLELAPDAGPAVPVEIVALYDGRCTHCRAPVAAGDRVVWTRDQAGVRCLRCGAREAA